MVNIVDALKGYVTSELVSKAASMLGEDASGITKAASSLIPTILGGMANKSTDTSAFGSIFDMLSDKQNDGWMDNLGGLLGGGNLAQGDPKDIAGGLMGSLFGSKVGGILDLVSSLAGIKKSSSSGLLGMVGPLVMSYLGRKIRKEGLDALGLGKLLGGQAPNIAAALPGGIGDLIGFAKNTGDSVSRTAASTRETVTRATSNVRETASAAASTATKHVEGGSGGGGKWLWPLLIAGLIGAGWYFMKGSGNNVMDAAGSVVDAAGDAAGSAVDAAGSVADAAGNAAGSAVDAAGNAVDAVGDAASGAMAALGKFFERTLPGGLKLNIPEMGIENKLLDFLEGSDAISKDAWLNFDRITFNTGSSAIDMEKSGEQIDNIASIMKAYPNMNIKIGGYTDNTGSAEGNLKLSQARADAVKAAIVAKVINSTRIETEGYGIAHPVATNDTPEGRAQNRRIAVNVTAK